VQGAVDGLRRASHRQRLALLRRLASLHTQANYRGAPASAGANSSGGEGEGEGEDEGEGERKDDGEGEGDAGERHEDAELRPVCATVDGGCRAFPELARRLPSV